MYQKGLNRAYTATKSLIRMPSLYPQEAEVDFALNSTAFQIDKQHNMYLRRRECKKNKKKMIDDFD